MTLNLQIVTPEQIAFQGEASEIQAPGWEGEFGVLPEHCRMLALSRPGIVTIYGSGQPERLLVGPGFAEVGPDKVNLLVSLCEDTLFIDKDAAAVDLKEAEADLLTLAPDSPEWDLARRRADLAAARLEA